LLLVICEDLDVVIPNNMYSFLISLFFILFTPLIANSIEIQFNFKNKEYPKLFITKFYGLTENIIAEKSVGSGIHKWKLKLNLENGFYRVKSENGENIDFIIDNQKKISININGKLSYSNCTSTDDLNNSYFEFQKFSRKTNEYFAKINSRIGSTLHKDSIIIYKTIKDSILIDYKNKVLLISEENKTNLLGITSSLLLEPEYIVNDTITAYEFQRIHFFDKINFNNPLILRSTILPNLYGRYFEKYVEYDEVGFKFAIDLILKKSSENSLVYEFTLDFLIKLFSAAGPEIILDYIIEKYYSGSTCNELANLSEVKSLLKLLPGNKIPIDSLFANYLTETEIKKIKKSKLTLLVFWSVHCEFCLNEIKLINQLYNNYKDLNIISIHIDLDVKSENEFYKTENIQFIKISENKSWDGPLVKYFRVNKTPMVYLVSNDGTIITRNTNGDDLKNVIDDNLK